MYKMYNIKNGEAISADNLKEIMSQKATGD